LYRSAKVLFTCLKKGGERMYAWGRRNEWMGWRGEGVGERIVGVVGKRREIGGRMMKKGRND